MADASQAQLIFWALIRKKNLNILKFLRFYYKYLFEIRLTKCGAWLKKHCLCNVALFEGKGDDIKNEQRKKQNLEYLHIVDWLA